MNIKAILSASLLIAAVAVSTANTPQYASQEVLVKFRTSNWFQTNLTHQRIGGKVLQQIPKLGWVRVRVPASVSVERAVNYYRSQWVVQAAEPNYKFELYFKPNDPDYSKQYGPAKMFTEEAWDLTQGLSNVIIAIIDTGVQLNHPDLSSKLVPGYDFSDDDPDPSDNDGHGTHVAGIAAAATNNGVGGAGVGFNSLIMPLKIFPNSFAANSAAAITYAADNGAKVINMSYGSYFPTQITEDAVNYAWSKGVLLVGAVGNDNIQMTGFPAAYPNVIAVGSSDLNDARSDFSNYGMDVDVAAPGSAIFSTNIGGGYAVFDGTSMASPMAAGAAALLWAHAGLDTPVAEVREALESTTDPIGPWLKFGRINIQRALEVLAPPVQVPFPVDSIDMFVGAGSIGDVTYVAATDGLRFTINSAASSLGQVAGAQVELSMTGDQSKLIRLFLEMEARGPIGGTAMTWFFNWNTGNYEFFKAFPLTTVDKVFNTEIPGKYIAPTGEVRFITRAHKGTKVGPHVPFSYQLNKVRLLGTFRN